MEQLIPGLEHVQVVRLSVIFSEYLCGDNNCSVSFSGSFLSS